MKKELKQEYIFNKVPTNLLWNSISTPDGLEQWFCDEASVDGDTYTFKWDDEEAQAVLKQSRVGVYMRFHWADDDDPKSSFELRISVDELTRDVILTVTETLDEEEYNDALELWDLQVSVLKTKYGV
ncbi:MAG: START-like domain-containing protein [Paludibacteraceae bacterium]|nr:START-like domain-containing protein [Paludibacteraceae bacterium]